jgi:hypothetical protein
MAAFQTAQSLQKNEPCADVRRRARFSYDDLNLFIKFGRYVFAETGVKARAYTTKCLLVRADESSPPRIRTSVPVHSGLPRLPGQ